MTANENRRPVENYRDLLTLDPDEVFDGYRAALRGDPCGDERSRSFWHGHRNGLVDCGKATRTEDQLRLAAEVDLVNSRAGRA